MAASKCRNGYTRLEKNENVQAKKKIFYTRLVIAGLQLMTKVLCYVLLGARFHGYVEYGINEEIDHKHGQNVRVQIDTVLDHFVDGKGDIAKRS